MRKIGARFFTPTPAADDGGTAQGPRRSVLSRLFGSREQARAQVPDQLLRNDASRRSTVESSLRERLMDQRESSAPRGEASASRESQGTSSAAQPRRPLAYDVDRPLVPNEGAVLREARLAFKEKCERLGGLPKREEATQDDIDVVTLLSQRDVREQWLSEGGGRMTDPTIMRVDTQLEARQSQQDASFFPWAQRNRR